MDEVEVKQQENDADSLSGGYATDDDQSSEECEYQFTAEDEKAFLETLACLKKNDPRIYDKNYRFFGEKSATTPKPKEKKETPMYFNDYKRQILMCGDGQIEDDDISDDENYDGEIISEEQHAPSYYEELEEIKSRILSNRPKALKSTTDYFTSKGYLSTKEKSAEEQAKEDEEIGKQIGDTEDGESGNTAEVMSYLRDYWDNANLNEGEEFLKDYILNKKYADYEDSQTVHQKLINIAAATEGDSKTIKRCPRIIENSIRIKNSVRKEGRKRRLERKNEEKQRNTQEVKKSQAEKRKEIIQRLEHIRAATGSQFNNYNFDGDFDEEAHNQKMNEMFGDDYYNEEYAEDEKPVFSDLELDQYEEEDAAGPSTTEKKKKKKKKKKNAEANFPDCEDPDFNMDCDFDPEMPGNSKTKELDIHPDEFINELEKQRGTFGNPEAEAELERCLAEYQELQCEDVVGEEKFRYKYRSVVPDDHGLSVDEILVADDNELNRWCPMSAVLKFNEKESDQWIVYHNYKQKAKHTKLKEKILPSLFSSNSEDLPTEDGEHNIVEVPKKKRKNKTTENEHNADNIAVPDKKKSKKKKNSTEMIVNADSAVQPAKETRKKKKAAQTVNDAEDLQQNVKEKKKKKQRENDNSVTPQNLDKKTKEKKATKRKANEADSQFSKSKKLKKGASGNWNNQSSDVTESLLPESRLQAYGINVKKLNRKLHYKGGK